MGCIKIFFLWLRWGWAEKERKDSTPCPLRTPPAPLRDLHFSTVDRLKARHGAAPYLSGFARRRAAKIFAPCLLLTAVSFIGLGIERTKRPYTLHPYTKRPYTPIALRLDRLWKHAYEAPYPSGFARRRAESVFAPWLVSFYHLTPVRVCGERFRRRNNSSKQQQQQQSRTRYRSISWLWPLPS